MPDWEGIVRRELGGLVLEPEERREVVAELAAHLEETCEVLLRQGMGEEEAVRRTLSQIGNSRDLRLRIQRARNEEDNMTDRVRQLWLPGLLTLLLSMVVLMVIQFVGPRPLIVSAHGWRMTAPVAVIYVPWLLSLIPIGAMGAYLAGRGGASQRAVLLSIVFPVLPYLALFVIALPVSLILDDHVAHNVRLSALLLGLLAWVMLPAMALLAGGLPVQLLRARRLASGQIANA
ncbi:MAG: permease prefix domain 1-containing protein [Candidatus Acidiferrales bacterium]